PRPRRSRIRIQGGRDRQHAEPFAPSQKGRRLEAPASPLDPRKGGSRVLREVLRQALAALRRNRLRSFLTMLGIVWGIVAVTVLIAYGSGFRAIVMRSFYAFGKSAVVVWPGQTSEQAGGERAGKRVRFEKADLELILQEGTYVKQASLETVRWLPISYGDRLANTAIRGIYPDYGEIRNEVP